MPLSYTHEKLPRVRAGESRTWLASLIAVACSLATTTPAAGGNVERGPAPPDIVVILTDDQRWDTLPWMPTVTQELIEKGITFENAFAHNPACCPSRASFLTGNYSHTTGVWSNSPPYGAYPAFTSEDDTLAVWLDDAGYRTAFMGKYLNQYEPSSHVPPGWDEWRAFLDPDYYSYSLSVNGNLVTKGSDPRDYSTSMFTRQADRFIHETDPGTPFLLYLALKAPHAPYTPAPRDIGTLRGLDPFRPPSFNEDDVSDKPAYIQAMHHMGAHQTDLVDHSRRKQLETIQSVDRSVGRILTALEETGRLHNTVIVFASDNGYAWGEHRWKAKLVPYEESIRIPLVIRWDAAGLPPGSVRALAVNVDLAPTLLDMAGLPAQDVDGRSLLPLLQGTHPPWRHAFPLEHVDEVTPYVPTYCGVRTRTETFVRYATGEEEYYRLDTDPYQLKNLASAPRWSERLAYLRSRTLALCDPLPPEMPPF